MKRRRYTSARDLGRHPGPAGRALLKALTLIVQTAKTNPTFRAALQEAIMHVADQCHIEALLKDIHG